MSGALIDVHEWLKCPQLTEVYQFMKYPFNPVNNASDQSLPILVSRAFPSKTPSTMVG